MDVVDRLLDNNTAYAAGYTDPGLSARPTKRVAVVTCMDARLDVHEMLGLRLGDVHVLRNAGGVVTDDTIRSLTVSQRLLGTRAVVVIHHTDCGLLLVTDAGFRQDVYEATGHWPTWDVGAFTDLEVDVRESVRRLEHCPFLPHRDRIRGLVHDVRTGRLHPVTSGRLGHLDEDVSPKNS